jgi:hypothetical protein
MHLRGERRHIAPQLLAKSSPSRATSWASGGAESRSPARSGTLPDSRVEARDWLKALREQATQVAILQAVIRRLQHVKGFTTIFETSFVKRKRQSTLSSHAATSS